MRVIEEKIIETFYSGAKKDYNLSIRDRVTVRLDGSSDYYLWETNLVHKSCTGELSIFLSSSTSEELRYYRYGRMSNYPPISNTTRGRINAFLWNCGVSGLYQRNWKLYWNKEELELDSWYTVDVENKRLVKQN